MRFIQLKQQTTKPVQYFIDTIVYKYNLIYECNQHQNQVNHVQISKKIYC